MGVSGMTSQAATAATETDDEKRVRLESILAGTALGALLAGVPPPPRTGKSSSSGSGVVGVLLSLGLMSSPTAGASVSGSKVGGSVWMNW
jgi:hypothetical protein